MPTTTTDAAEEPEDQLALVIDDEGIADIDETAEVIPYRDVSVLGLYNWT